MPEQDPNQNPEEPIQDAAAESTEAPAQAPKDTADASSMAEEALEAANDALSSFEPNAPTGEDPVTPTADADPSGASTADNGTAGQVGGFAPTAFDGMGTPRALPDGLDLLADVNLNVKIELGRTRMFVEDVLRLNSGSVVELDKLAGDPVDIYVNDRPVARGEVLVLNDNFCVRISEIISQIHEGDVTDADDSGAAA